MGPMVPESVEVATEAAKAALSGRVFGQALRPDLGGVRLGLASPPARCPGSPVGGARHDRFPTSLDAPYRGRKRAKMLPEHIPAEPADPVCSTATQSGHHAEPQYAKWPRDAKWVDAAVRDAHDELTRRFGHPVEVTAIERQCVRHGWQWRGSALIAGRRVDFELLRASAVELASDVDNLTVRVRTEDGSVPVTTADQLVAA